MFYRNSISIGIPAYMKQFALKIKNMSTNELHEGTTIAAFKNWISGEDLIKSSSTDIPKLWSPYLPKTGLAAITGPSDCGKSSLIRQLALSIVTGRTNFLGSPLVTKHKRAYLICTEDSAEAIGGHLKTLKESKGIKDGLDRIVFLFNFESAIDELDKRLTAMPADIIVLDAWLDTFQGNVNNPVDVRRDLDHYRKLCEKHNCLCIIVHHNTKNSEKLLPDKNKLNGSQAIEAKMRCVLDFRIGNIINERYLTITKGNYLPDSLKKQSLLLQFDPTSRSITYTGTKIDKDALIDSLQMKKYDPIVWVPIMNKFRIEQNLSYENAREQIVKTHSGKDIPKLTWFKENCKLLEVKQKAAMESDNTVNHNKINN